MPKRNNINHSTRSRPRLSSLSGLITPSENTMTSTQATIISINSQAPYATQSQDRWVQLQNYQDIIGDQNQTLKISPEEEKRIQSILQLARKGKINPGNAFDIPVKVADPHLGEGQNMRFWKFASELLAVSMGIYDKRVEHVYLGTNRMIDKLLRVASNKPQIQQPEEKANKQRGQIMKIQVADLANAETLMSYNFASVNCQQPEKINVKRSLLQFGVDPLFTKRLQAFDSDSLRSLFLNAFQTGKDLQIVFFHQSEQQQPIPINQMQIESAASISQEQQDMQSTKTESFQLPQFPRIINQDFKKLALIAQTGTCFSGLGNFRRQNARTGIFAEQNLVQDFSQNLKQQINLNINTSQNQSLANNSLRNELDASFAQDNNEDYTHLSEDLRYNSEQTLSTQKTQSQRFNSEYLLFSQNLFSQNREINSVINPWEYQFSGLKLQKKKVSRKTRKNRDQLKKGKEIIEGEINFFDIKTPQRSAIFKSSKEQPEPRTLKFQEKHLLPKNVDLFVRNEGFKSNNAQSNQFNRKSEHQQKDHRNHTIEDSSEFHFNNLQNNNNLEAEEVEDNNPFPQRWNLSQQSSQNNQNSLKNIRNLKDRIFEQVSEKGQVKLSDVDISLSPSSIFVVLLHLVNEQRISIESMEDNSDIYIHQNMARP